MNRNALPTGLYTLFLFLIFFVAAGCSRQSFGLIKKNDASSECSYDESTMLSLNEKSFDQTPLGWRSIAKDNGNCYSAAANLISKYREKKKTASYLLYFHEGQLRAFLGENQAAIPLFEKAARPSGSDKFWNLYVSGTIAFISRDRPALKSILDSFHSAQVKNGVRTSFETFKTPDGNTITVAVPLNVDVLEALDRCFDRPYREAYSAQCRKKQNSDK